MFDESKHKNAHSTHHEGGLLSPSIYLKFSQMFPILGGQSPSDEGTDYFSSKDKDHGSPKPDSDGDNEIDTAQSESSAPSGFLNVLTTASLYSGTDYSKLKESIFNIASKARRQPAHATHEAKHHKFYEGYESSSEDSSDDEEEEEEKENEAELQELKKINRIDEEEEEDEEEEDYEDDGKSIDEQRTLNTIVIPEPNENSLSAAACVPMEHSQSNSSQTGDESYHTSDVRSLSDRSNHQNKSASTHSISDINKLDSRDSSQKYTFPSVNGDLSPFQASVVSNLNPNLVQERFLVRMDPNMKYEDTAEAKRLKLRLQIADELQKVFEIDDDDYFVGNYSVWLIKDVLLQGHLYLTRDSVLFFAFLPKYYSLNQPSGSYTTYDDSNLTIQSGSLGLKTAKYGETVFTTVITHRYWAILRPQTLTIYSSSTELHFPNIVIDLKSCIKAEIIHKEKDIPFTDHTTKAPTRKNSGDSTPKHHGASFRDNGGSSSPRFFHRRNSNDGVSSPKSPQGGLSPFAGNNDMHLSTDDESYFSNMLSGESMEPTEDSIDNTTGVWFKLVSKNKTYKFHTDNLYVARQWCHNLTKLIFQLNNSNSGNEVIIKIPIKNMLDFDKFGISADPDDTEESGDKDEEDEDEEKMPHTVRMHYFHTGGSYEQPSASARWKKPKSSSKAANGLGIEQIYFLFFDRSSEFYTNFTDMVRESQFSARDKSDSSLTSKKSSRFRQRAKKMVGRDASGSIDSSKRDFARSLSTLKSSNSGSSNSIIEQMAPINTHLKSPAISIDHVDDEDNEKNTNVTGTLRKIGRSLSNPTKMFSSKKSTESLTSLGSCNYEKPDVEHYDDIHSTTSPVQNANLPRSISLAGLNSLRKGFETIPRDYESEDSRFSVLSSKMEQLTPITAQNDDMQEQMNFAGPLGLQDPSEYPPPEKKSTKLQSMKKSIKTFSNVSNKWSANPTHYVEVDVNHNHDEGNSPGSDPYYVKDPVARETSQEHFEDHFSLGPEMPLVASYYCHLNRSIPIYGKLYLAKEYLCFRSLLPGVSTKMILPLKDIEKCYKEKGIKLTYSRLVLVVNNYEELILEFSYHQSRDDSESMILRQLESIHEHDMGWSPSPHDWGRNYDLGLTKHREGNNYEDEQSLQIKQEKQKRLARARIETARLKMFEERVNVASGLDIPIVLEDSPFYKTKIRPITSYHFVLLTVGSRGDVQPYIALGKGLISEGHSVTIATHIEFKEWIEKHGMKFTEIAGNPAELMSLMVTHGSMSVSFLKEAASKFRGWINELLTTSWDACQGADILIESPSAMGGLHIAEALGIPYMRAFTMPWTRTRAYPHAFIVPDQKKGGSYNYLTHVMFETVFWKGISSQVNQWRVKDLGLPKTNLYRMQQTKIPFLYNVSPTILPPAVDFPDWVKVTGYWFLDEGSADDYDPPKELVEFMDQAARDQKKIVYIGFGSIVVNDAKSMTKAICEAVVDADVRCILNKGWSDRLSKKDDKDAAKEPEVELPPEIYNAGTVPHDWLFSRIDAAVHHGGSGTTGATLRAGLPTIIKPFFGDQFFYATRIEDAGVGLGLKKLNAKSLSKAIVTVTTDLKIIQKSKKFSERIKLENGVMSAVETIYSEMEYARHLIHTKQKHNEHYRHHHPDFTSSGAQTPVVPEESEEESTDDEDSDDETEDAEDSGEEQDSNATSHSSTKNPDLVESSSSNVHT